jgi:hypothetical protein
VSTDGDFRRGLEKDLSVVRTRPQIAVNILFPVTNILAALPWAALSNQSENQNYQAIRPSFPQKAVMIRSEK